MTAAWKETTLGDFVTLQRGHDLTDSQRRPGNVPVMGSAGQNGFHDTVRAKGPGIVIGRSGASFGQVHFSQEDFWPHNTALYVTDFKGNDPKFAFYFLKAIDFSRYNSGSAQPSLNRNFIYPISVRIPPITEQKRIAHILGTLDDKIELNRRMNATLEAMARALFQSWFVDFDPVRRNAEGGDSRPEDALFPDSLEDSPEGVIPRGWSKTNLGKETDLSFGFAFKSAQFILDGDVRLARGDNVKEGFFHWDSKARYWPEITPDIESYRLEIGDVLIGMDGSKVGKNWVRVRRCDLPCLLVQRVARLRAKKSIGQHFIWILVSNQRFRNHVDKVKTGTSIPHISGGQIKAYDFVRPSAGDNRVFDRFEELVGPLGSQIDANVEQSKALAVLRDTLLPKFLSGKLDLKSKSLEFA